MEKKDLRSIYYLLMIAAGSLLGSIIPGFFENSQPAGGLSPFSFPLLLDALLKILIAILTLMLIKEPSRHASPYGVLAASFNAAPELARTVLRHIKAGPSIVLIFAGGAALALGMGSVESFWQPRFAGLSPDGGFGILFGLVMSGCFLVGALSSLAAPRISAFPGGSRVRTALFFTLTAAASLLFLSFVESRLVTAIGMMAVYASTEGASVPRKALLNDSIPGSIRATMLSMDSMSSYLGFACVVVLGFLAKSTGIPMAWRTAALLILAMSWVYPLYTRLSNKAGTTGAVERGNNFGEEGL